MINLINSREKAKIISFFILLFILVFFIYKDSFFSYFFQDDWFSLRISSISSFSDISKFFIPRTDVIYYRPIGMQLPFFILKAIFGINPIPFRLLTIITHFINSILAYILLYKITNKRIIGYFGSFCYAISTIHYIPFFWSATYAFVLGPTLSFLSIILFLLFIERDKTIWFILSFLAFLFGLFTYEMTAVIPVLLVIYLFLIVREKKKIFMVIPFFIIDLFLLILRFRYFSLPSTSDYQYGFGRYIVQNLQGYVLWSINWPEEMKAQFINFYTINPQFIHDFPLYFYVFFASFILYMLIFIVIPIFRLILHHMKFKFTYIILGASWFIVGLLPVLFFPQHSFAYYLPLSFVGLSLVLFSIFHQCYGKDIRNNTISFLISAVFLSVWSITSYVTVDFNSKVHWAPRRAKLAETLIGQTKSEYDISSITSIYISPSSENKHALNNQDAFIVLSGNDNFITYFGTNTILK